MDILAGEDCERSVRKVCKKPIIWQPLKLGYTFLRRDDEQASPINPELYCYSHHYDGRAE